VLHQTADGICGKIASFITFSGDRAHHFSVDVAGAITFTVMPRA
jgi:hypothetical protein